MDLPHGLVISMQRTRNDKEDVTELTGKSEPAYRRIERDLRQRLRKGEWNMGAVLPSRQMLARGYGVDLSTVQKAVANMLSDGTLRADNGRGTYVARDPFLADDPDPSGEKFAIESGSIDSLSFDGDVLTNLPAVQIGTVGILCSFLNQNDFWPRTLIHTVERLMASVGVTTVFVNRSSLGDDLAPNILSPFEGAQRLRHAGAEAMVYIAVREDPNDEEIAQVVSGFCGDYGDPSRVVAITSGMINLPIAHVFYDQNYAGFRAARLLIESGIRKNILFVAPFHTPWVRGRWEGASQAIQLAGLPADALKICPPVADLSFLPPRDPGEIETELASYAAVDSYLANHGEEPQGVIGANDNIARAFAVAYAEGTGRRPGADYALIGFDDEPASRDFGLTTLRPPLEEMAREAVQLLLRAVRGDNVSQQIRLRSYLVPRRSTRTEAVLHPIQPPGRFTRTRIPVKEGPLNDSK
ncbi:MAG: substrate-binding domain-containing protein [Fibrella sp.]|nr:substrate-binding domain-containing protein [Armatimonadota bacterium]